MRTADKRSGPLVLHIRMSGRLVPFAAVLLLFALLPFLAGSTSGPPPATSVVLAAGSPAAVQDAVDAVGQARDELAGLESSATVGSAAGSMVSSAVGGGLFLFPAISLAPVTAGALAAPLTGVPFFIHPVPGGETSPFGFRIHPLLGRPMFHTGIDLAAACGTPIRAAADGTVIYAQTSASWGLRTIIQHTPTVKTAYGHQSKFLVTEGQQVKQGQIIGLSGTTGWSTGCHLHFDVIVNDRYVDPAPYLGFPPSAAASVPYAVVPYVVLDQGGSAVQTVEDGDVPISEASVAPPAPASIAPRPAALTGSSASPKPGVTGNPAATSARTTTTVAPTPTGSPAPSPTTSTPSATVPASVQPSPTPSTTPPPTTSTTPPPPPPSSTTPPPTTSSATQPSTSTTAVPTPTTSPTCPTSGPSPTTTATTGTDPMCATQTSTPTG